MSATLPRVTYTNIREDFSPVHALLDEQLPKIEHQLLGREHLNHIGGARSTDGVRYTSLSPIDHTLVLGQFYQADKGAVDAAVRAAKGAYAGWRAWTWQERVAVLRRVADELERQKWEIGIAALLEVGKSRFEAMGEAEEAIDMVRYYCDEMERQNGYVRPLARAFDFEHTEVCLRPYGVFAVIAPFNYPVALSVGMMTGALLTGNAVVFKPSPHAGLTAMLLADAFHRGGVPAAALNVVCGNHETGQALVDHPGVDGFAFTGSMQVGMHLHRTAAAGRFVRPVIAEMGGKNPAYVSRHADLDKAVEGVMRSAFGLQGQKCSAQSKVYVQASIAAAFTEKLLARVAAIEVGDPRSASVFMGPLINQEAYRRYQDAVAAAQRDGVLLAGGARVDQLAASGEADNLAERGYYVLPTIVTGLPARHPLHTEEQFLPLLPLIEFDDLQDAIAAGNAVDFGLAAGIYTEDREELAYFLEHAEAGVLYANRASGATTGAWPGIQTFCGWKGSGVSGKGGLGPYYLPQFLREQSRTVIHPDGGAKR